MEHSFFIPCGSRNIPCILSAPAAGTPQRVVLSVHGLGGSKNDAIQSALAEELPLFSCAVMRFDLPAHGDSPEDDTTLCLESCRQALLAVAGWLRQEYPDARELCIFATGFGAYVTLTCLEELIDLAGQVKLVVQTPSVMMHATILSMLRMTRETLWAMDRVSLPAPRPIDITYSFFEELRSHIVLNAQPIPMLILHGESDAYIHQEDIQNFRRINERSRLVYIPGASHRFVEEGAWDMVLDLTRDWFSFEQVLLCDWE
jgi:alpha-beta hydrolase superfamily lysophospholipase